MSVKRSSHRQAYAYCAYCPKVCRFSCPVSEATRSETTSPWGKMTEAFLTTEGKRPVEEGGAKALYACTGCMRCRSFCLHENEVGFALFSARAQALEGGTAPKGAQSTLKTFADAQNPFGRDLHVEVSRFRAEQPVRYPFFPGCSSLVKRPELVEQTLAVAERFAAPLGVGKASARCCGYPLYAAGALDDFAQHAQKVAKSFSDYPELVVLDPGCAYTLKVVYPRVGVEMATTIRTVYEVLEASLPHAPKLPRLSERAAYHDACHLGRGLGEYEGPRRLLSAAVGEWVEASENREQAGCSGGGGLLPRTWPEAAVESARLQSARLSGGETIVTACPTSRRMFERAGKRAEDLMGLLRRWLAQEASKP